MSENIFTEIYNKILGLFGQTAIKDESKNTAVNRLRLVLMQDRTNLTPEIMHRMRSELIEVLSKYVELDRESLELNFEQEGEQMALMLSIPVVRAKDEAEIQETLKKEDEAKKSLEKSKNADEEKEDIEDNEEIINDEDKKSDSDETSSKEISQDQGINSDNEKDASSVENDSEKQTSDDSSEGKEIVETRVKTNKKSDEKE